ncbi:MAG TPA: cytochrome D1 domain-containing protein [Longimicrobiales bacterium]
MIGRKEVQSRPWRGRSGIATALVLASLRLAFAPDAARAAQQSSGSPPAVRPVQRTSHGGTGAAEGVASQRITKEGVTISLDVRRANGSPGLPRRLEEARLSVTVKDAETGAPVTEAIPAAWVDWRRGEAATPADVCGDKIARYVSGTLKFRPEVDLNSYYVLALTRGPQIAVIDPMLGFGNSKLYTTVLLPAPGADWARSPDHRTVYVSLPEEGKVAFVDTDEWEVTESVAAGAAPTRLLLEPDGRRLWVANDAPGAAGGVTAIDVASRSVAATFRTGGGTHTMALTDDGRLFVASSEGETVTVIDTGTLEVLAEIRTGAGPSDLAYSPVLGSVFVVHERDGSIVAINAATLEMRGRDDLEPGLNAIRIVPVVEGGHGHGHAAANPVAGRIAFITNGREHLVHVYDVENGRLLRTVAVFEGPDQIAFSSSFAYIRSSGSPEVTMVPLSDPTSGGVGVFDHFPAGSAIPTVKGAASVADAIVQAPDMPDAVFVANAGENAIYYYHYMEGMPTPSGSLSTYGFVPTGVMLVGRKLRETGPGAYEATIRLDRPGEYDVAFLLPEPRVVHCFPFTVVENPAIGEARVALRIEPVAGTMLRVGESTLRLRLFDAFTGEPAADVDDLVLQLAATTGWRTQVVAAPLGGGEYEMRVRVPSAGVYYVSFAVPSRGITVRDRPPLVVRAVAAEAGRATR